MFFTVKCIKTSIPAPNQDFGDGSENAENGSMQKDEMEQILKIGLLKIP